MKSPGVSQSLGGVTSRLLTPQDAEYFTRDVYPLLEARIPRDDLKPAKDMVRWLSNPSSDCSSYFIVAERGSRNPLGFLYLHKRVEVPYAFISYLVVKRGQKPASHAADEVPSSLLQEVMCQMRRVDCALNEAEGFLVELAHPDTASSARERKERIARFRHFQVLAEKTGFQLQAVDVPYVQPPLSSTAEREGISHLLVLGRKNMGAVSSALSRQEAERILEALYVRLYPSSYSDDPAENAAFRQICHSILTKVVQDLPEAVNLLGYRDLL